jgi:hypothetical protein
LSNGGAGARLEASALMTVAALSNPATACERRDARASMPRRTRGTRRSRTRVSLAYTALLPKVPVVQCTAPSGGEKLQWKRWRAGEIQRGQRVASPLGNWLKIIYPMDGIAAAGHTRTAPTIAVT